MEALLKKIQNSGYDVTYLSGHDAISLWEEISKNVAETEREKALCLLISSEYLNHARLYEQSIQQLHHALQLISDDEDEHHIELQLSIKQSLCECYIATRQYALALAEYVLITKLAMQHYDLDSHASAIIGMGRLCEHFGDYNRAIRYYKKIDHIDHALSSRNVRLQYKLYKLGSYIRLQRYKAAQALLLECEELSILVNDKLLNGKVLLYKARLYRFKGKLTESLNVLSTISYTLGAISDNWFACACRIEQAYCMSHLNKPHLAIYLLDNAHHKVANFYHPKLKIDLYNAYSDLYTKSRQYQQALGYEKLAFECESELISLIPIAELGANQLRRLSQLDLQLKLILSEIENRELKETTETQRNAVAQLQQDVFTDPLTQMHNRRWLDSQLKDMLLHDTNFAFLIIDIDHFKSINDDYSHLVGDQAISRVSMEIRHYFNDEGQHWVRFGGEEFLVIIENKSLAEVNALAEQLRHNIAQTDWQDMLGDRQLTVSIGTTLHRLGENTQRTFNRADKALYRAKANGRNQVCYEE